MSVLKESYAIRTEFVFVPLGRLEGTLVLWLSSETSIARLEVRTGDVRLGELVKARVDFPRCTQRILVGNLRVDYPFETVITCNLDAIRFNLGLIF